ncbi:hypothetical protein, partial [Treponema sp. UBA7567]|uniref:hypothetical protein n=1 Tax=Treponema sp. UBA7567 TaxID=1947748 RepID=UPI0025CBCDB9
VVSQRSDKQPMIRMIRKFATQTFKDKTDAVFGYFYLIFFNFLLQSKNLFNYKSFFSVLDKNL